jgi:hypothetical protein
MLRGCQGGQTLDSRMGIERLSLCAINMIFEVMGGSSSTQSWNGIQFEPSERSFGRAKDLVTFVVEDI